jgi:hypothetical protein
MGWSQGSVTNRYQHSTAGLVAGIAKQVGGLLWAPDEPDTEGPQPAN